MTGTDNDGTAGKDRTEGLAEQSLNTSVVQPGQGGAGHGDRGLTENDQRKGLEKTERNRPDEDDGRKPQGS